MNKIINTIVIVMLGILIAPAFAYADTVSCSPAYSNDLTGKTVTFTARPDSTNQDSYTFSWTGDDGISADGQSFTHQFNQPGNMQVNVKGTDTTNPGNPDINGSCSVNIVTADVISSATCDPNTNRAVIGQNITWNPSIYGLLAPYSVVWSGTDEFSSTAYNASIVYTTSGDKSAKMVSVKSRYGDETSATNLTGDKGNISCAHIVNVVDESVHHPVPLSVTGTCAPAQINVYANNPVAWTSNLTITGGTAPYVITWSDSESENIGTGASVSKTYTTIGTKMAYLTVTNDPNNPNSTAASSEIDCTNLSVVDAPVSGGGGGGGATGTNYYSINVSSGDNGSISPSSADIVSGSNQTFTITPKSGYQIIDVLVDGKSVGAVTTYTFTNTSAGHTISAIFSPINGGTPVITTTTTTTTPTITTNNPAATITIINTPAANKNGNTGSSSSGETSGASIVNNDGSTEQSLEANAAEQNANQTANLTGSVLTKSLTASIRDSITNPIAALIIAIILLILAAVYFIFVRRKKEDNQ